MLFCSLLAPLVALPAVAAPDGLSGGMEKKFSTTVRPYLETYCLACHNTDKKKGDLDLSLYQSADSVVKDFQQWEKVARQVQEEEMPPEKAKVHPTRAASREIIEWFQGLRREEAKRHAGDPGLVLARRLSNAEYNNSIRDLTGFDLKPTKEFPVDPANVAGFDNSGESLAMSPGLLNKYLEAAREVANHLVLQPEGFAFSPHPVITETDRDKYAVNRIIHFYRNQKTDYADYFLAAWKYKNRAALGKPRASLADFADESQLSRKYLETLWTTLQARGETLGPIAALQTQWKALPAPTNRQTDIALAGCRQMRDFVVQLRERLVPKVKNLTARGIHEGSQSFVLWKNRQFAENRRRLKINALGIETEDLAAGHFLTPPTTAEERQQYEAGFARFCSTFPDAFFISERARVYLDAEQEKDLVGRHLSAGFHSMMGYFRDDAPLYELMLDEKSQRQLDTLWQELDFISSAPMRQHTGFIWFERTDSGFMRGSEFEFARAEDKDSTSQEKIGRLAQVYLEKARRLGAGTQALEVIADFFQRVNTNVRAVESDRVKAEPSHLKTLLTFAERAARRPLSPEEGADLLNFYRSLRTQDGLSHEDALRDCVVSVLLSPSFCYRVDLVEEGDGIRKLDDYALASRLSYFLWSTMPDEVLLARAKAGDLHEPKVLLAEARRMMKDERIRGLALEFAGNWLDVRRFEEHNSVNRERFPTFNNALRQAMFEEPMQFFTGVVRGNQSILDFLYADYTYVNEPLARHYGMTNVSFQPGQWTRVEHVRPFQRGGLLPMSVFLTKNAPGDRTSPVKRGNWVIKNLLGEHVPAPPAVVPELVSDEKKMGALTLRQMLAKHREDKSCATCHDRFDSIGLAFEGFGMVGEARTVDLAGRAVDSHATFPGGREGSGVEGLLTYIRDHRQADFVDNLSRKLLTYALGRSLMISDDALLSDLQARLKSNGYRFSEMIDVIVTSPQFLNKRSQSGFVKN